MKGFRAAALTLALLGTSAFAQNPAWGYSGLPQQDRMGGGSALAQGAVWGYSGLPQPDRDDRHAYREGYEQGRADADNRRPPRADVSRYREDDDRRAYREGYSAGYKGAQHEEHDFYRDKDRHDEDRDRDHYDGDGDRDRHDGDRDRAASANAGYGSLERIARENGYRDGMNDGQKDRATGHSFRPTHDDNYKNAPGYSSNMGDRQQYKNFYRSAYEQAYPQGYNGRR